MALQGSEMSEGVTTYFKVVMEDFEEAVFQSCDGLQAEIDVVYIPEGGKSGAPHAVRGQPRVNKIVFSKGSVSAKGSKRGLFDWFLDVCDYSKPLKRQTLTIQLLDSQRNSIRSWKVLDAWPCRWLGPSLNRDGADLTVEYLEFAHEGIRP